MYGQNKSKMLLLEYIGYMLKSKDIISTFYDPCTLTQLFSVHWRDVYILYTTAQNVFINTLFYYVYHSLYVSGNLP